MLYGQFFIEGYCFSQKSLLEACLSQEARRECVCWVGEFEGHRGRYARGEPCLPHADGRRSAGSALFSAHVTCHETLSKTPKAQGGHPRSGGAATLASGAVSMHVADVGLAHGRCFSKRRLSATPCQQPTTLVTLRGRSEATVALGCDFKVRPFRLHRS